MDVDYDRLAFVSLRVQRTDFRKAGQAVGRCSLDRKCRLGCSPFFNPAPDGRKLWPKPERIPARESFSVSELTVTTGL